jgi:hypothetical protein
LVFRGLQLVFLNTLEKDKILVKVITKGSHLIADKPSSTKNTAFPRQIPEWGSCRFVFGNEQHYDWLVVYDDFVGKIDLKCPPQNTLLVTLEPSSIKTYESAYIRQFGYVLTGQEDWALKHPGKIHSQPGLFWYYGTTRTYDQIAQGIPHEKTLDISTVTSSKCQSHTLHKKRNFFIEELQKKLPQLDRFGRGIREISDKADALDSYKYHIAIENHRCDHWWTEKLADAFLGCTLPFYCGAPNAGEYFPSQSFIEIDINDPVESSKIISNAIKNNEYEKRLPQIHKARKLVLKKYNFYATISKMIEQRNLKGKYITAQKQVLLSRNELRKFPHKAIMTLLEKIRNRSIAIVGNIRG